MLIWDKSGIDTGSLNVLPHDRGNDPLCDTNLRRWRNIGASTVRIPVRCANAERVWIHGARRPDPTTFLANGYSCPFLNVLRGYTPRVTGGMMDNAMVNHRRLMDRLRGRGHDSVFWRAVQRTVQVGVVGRQRCAHRLENNCPNANGGDGNEGSNGSKMEPHGTPLGSSVGRRRRF